MAQIGLHLSYEFLNLAKRFCLTLHLFMQNDQVRIPPLFTSDTARTTPFIFAIFNLVHPIPPKASD